MNIINVCLRSEDGSEDGTLEGGKRPRRGGGERGEGRSTENDDGGAHTLVSLILSPLSMSMFRLRISSARDEGMDKTMASPFWLEHRGPDSLNATFLVERVFVLPEDARGLICTPRDYC